MEIDGHRSPKWLDPAQYRKLRAQTITVHLTQLIPPSHPHWDGGPDWKRTLNNLRLLLQPYLCACLLIPWLRVLPLPHLQAGLADLCALMNTFHPVFPTWQERVIAAFLKGDRQSGAAAGGARAAGGPRPMDLRGG